MDCDEFVIVFWIVGNVGSGFDCVVGWVVGVYFVVLVVLLGVVVDGLCYWLVVCYCGDCFGWY